MLGDNGGSGTAHQLPEGLHGERGVLSVTVFENGVDLLVRQWNNRSQALIKVVVFNGACFGRIDS